MKTMHTNTSLRFLGEADFDSQVLRSPKALLVAFWAPWSKPCRVIDPVLLEVARACAGKIEVVKVNADDNPCLGLCFAVQHIPTLLLFLAGELRGRLVGTVSKDAILNLLSRGSEAGCGDVSLER
ncbi:MAG TPA: thioredoxin domain-containing protein [Verrucomicrobiae bacterium]|nr:thioredoxin domain-containing protein [Verrucomicrobiae bacterium]